MAVGHGKPHGARMLRQAADDWTRSAHADEEAALESDSRRCRLCDHAEITKAEAVLVSGISCQPSGWGGRGAIEVSGDKMSAESVVYYLNRVPESDPNDQTEWLLTALGQYTGAELRELLYVAEEPGFFELIRGLFALSDESRAVLQHFLETGHPLAMKAAIDPKGRLTIDRVDTERVKLLPVIAS